MPVTESHNMLPADQRTRAWNQSRLLDRRWLEKDYLPRLGGRILFVGVSSYTNFYHELVQTPQQFETIDLKPEFEKYGSPFKHYTGDFLELQPGHLYDHIALNGLFGMKHIISDPAFARRIIEHAHSLLAPGGTLMIGSALQTVRLSFWQEMLHAWPLRLYRTEQELIIRPDLRHPNGYFWVGKKFYRSLPETLASRKVLFVVCHQDDESLFFGGLLTRIKDLCRIHILVLTDPRPGRPDTATRLDSFRRVCELTGATYSEGHFPDRGAKRILRYFLSQYRAVRHTVARTLRDVEPDIVITHNPAGEYGNSYHKMVSQACFSALKSTASRADLYAGTVGWRRCSLDHFLADYAVEDKKRLMDCYLPHWSPFPYPFAYDKEIYARIDHEKLPGWFVLWEIFVSEIRWLLGKLRLSTACCYLRLMWRGLLRLARLIFR